MPFLNVVIRECWMQHRCLKLKTVVAVWAKFSMNFSSRFFLPQGDWQKHTWQRLELYSDNLRKNWKIMLNLSKPSYQFTTFRFSKIDPANDEAPSHSYTNNGGTFPRSTSPSCTLSASCIVIDREPAFHQCWCRRNSVSGVTRMKPSSIYTCVYWSQSDTARGPSGKRHRTGRPWEASMCGWTIAKGCGVNGWENSFILLPAAYPPSGPERLNLAYGTYESEDIERHSSVWCGTNCYRQL